MCCEGLGTLLVVIALGGPERRRRRVKERGKRVEETQRGALATRKPMMLPELTGVVLLR
jgi:hypothetical protein